MDYDKIGRLIYSLRKDKKLTQQQLADTMNISDKTISKWERGLGCPDVSLLPALSAALDINLENLLSGTLDANDLSRGNMKQLSFYVCPTCGNLLTGTSKASVSCCGKPLRPLEAKKADSSEKLSVELIENEYFISSEHEMTKGHYISFIALITGDSIVLRRQYPEWNIQARLPRLSHGKLIWYCTNHGLFYQLL